MVIVKAFGGLGNQMFQYALCEELISREKKVKLDISWFDDNLDFLKNNKINELFVLNCEIASRSEIERYGDGKMDYLSRARRKIFGRKKSWYGEKVDNWGKYLSLIKELDDVYLEGYWQTEKYFEQSGDIVRNVFMNKQRFDHNSFYVQTKNSINETENSVSLHVRLGVYDSDTFGGICENDYYERCIDYLTSVRGRLKIFVFSNDIEKAIKLPCLKDQDCYAVSNNTGNNWEDIYLMGECRDNIIANSSFSWWGAWLNNHDDKIVVAPKKWFNIAEAPDIVPEKWIKL